MKIEGMQDLFEIGLRYVYDCENKLVKKGLPSMIEASSSPELRQAFEQHLRETQNHVTRLQQVFSMIGKDADTEGNDILDDMTKQAEKMIKNIEASPLRDAALIVSGNEVEHYEMAAYGSLVAFAQQLGYGDAARLLQQTLDEEKAADAKLTQLGERSINPTAAQHLRAA
jgi:ferritin-like metal-binding protein YciE